MASRVNSLTAVDLGSVLSYNHPYSSLGVFRHSTTLKVQLKSQNAKPNMPSDLTRYGE